MGHAFSFLHMSYLILNDYKGYIQAQYLSQLVQGDQSKRIAAEDEMIHWVTDAIKTRFNADIEFTDTAVWNKNTAYGAGSRVYIDASATGFAQWVTLTAYVIGDPVYYQGYGYYCTVSNSDAAFTPAKWAVAGAQYAIFHGAYPATCTLNGVANPATLMNPYAPVFNYKNLYAKDDVVFWKGDTYVCNQASTVLSHQSKLQYTEYSNIPYNNVFPDDPVANSAGQYWKTRTAYTITAGTRLTNSAWVAADNRTQTIKKGIIKLVVFELSPLIAPMNRPEIWLEERRDFCRYIRDVMEGKCTLTLPPNQPNNAVRTYHGGNVKNINNYATLLFTLKMLALCLWP